MKYQLDEYRRKAIGLEESIIATEKENKKLSIQYEDSSKKEMDENAELRKTI